jgi:hypothetical protein
MPQDMCEMTPQEERMYDRFVVLKKHFPGEVNKTLDTFSERIPDDLSADALDLYLAESLPALLAKNWISSKLAVALCKSNMDHALKTYEPLVQKRNREKQQTLEAIKQASVSNKASGYVREPIRGVTIPYQGDHSPPPELAGWHKKIDTLIDSTLDQGKLALPRPFTSKPAAPQAAADRSAKHQAPKAKAAAPAAAAREKESFEAPTDIDPLGW